MAADQCFGLKPKEPREVSCPDAYRGQVQRQRVRAVTYGGAEMKMELWESAVLSYPLKHTQAGMGFSVGRFIVTQRPACGKSRTCNLQLYPIPLLSQVAFPPKCFSSWEDPPYQFPKTSSGHQFLPELSSPQQ